MSMTQVAFLKKAEIPTKEAIQNHIKELGYNFEIFDNFYGLDGVDCRINGLNTFFELCFHEPTEIANEWVWIKPDLSDQDTAISFVWGADYAAGACIGLILIALIDLSNALVYYLDDEMKYSREMLIADTPQFINELEKQSSRTATNDMGLKPQSTSPRKSFWDKLKDLFK